MKRHRLKDRHALQILACMTNPFMTGSIVYLDGGYLLQ
jgi:hypothetical protein